MASNRIESFQPEHILHQSNPAGSRKEIHIYLKLNPAVRCTDVQ